MSQAMVKQIVLASRPKGPPVPANFRMEEVPLPQMSPNGLLLRVLYLSLDPYMRGRMDDAKSYAKSVGVGEVMTGESIYQVIASDRAGYVKGDIALAPTGWLTHAAWDGPALRKRRHQRRSRQGWACSACPVSPPMRGSTSSASRKRERPSLLPPTAGQSARWSVSSPAATWMTGGFSRTTSS
jgi:NADPH-dependent curcumin reductase CurA